MDNITSRFSSHPIPASHSYPFSLYPVGNLRHRCFYNRGYTGDVHDVRRTSLLFILSPSWTKAIEMLLVAIEDLTIAGSWKVIAAETLTVTGYLKIT